MNSIHIKEREKCRLIPWGYNDEGKDHIFKRMRQTEIREILSDVLILQFAEKYLEGTVT